MNDNPSAPEIPPEAIAFATRMYDAARAGQIEVFQQALPAGLPANLTNDKGDSLVSAYIFRKDIENVPSFSRPRVVYIRSRLTSSSHSSYLLFSTYLTLLVLLFTHTILLLLTTITKTRLIR